MLNRLDLKIMAKSYLKANYGKMLAWLSLPLVLVTLFGLLGVFALTGSMSMHAYRAAYGMGASTLTALNSGTVLLFGLLALILPIVATLIRFGGLFTIYDHALGRKDLVETTVTQGWARGLKWQLAWKYWLATCLAGIALGMLVVILAVVGTILSAVTHLLILLVPLVIALVVFAIWFAIPFNLIPYTLYETPDESVFTIVNNAFIAIKGHRWEYIMLNLSFIGWQFLSLFTYNLLGFFYVIPYVSIANTLFFAQLIHQQNFRKETPAAF